MSPYPVIPLQIHRTGIEVCLHCPEAILNHPSAAVSLEDCRSRTVKVRADNQFAYVELVIYFLLQRFECNLLICIAGIDAEGQRKSVHIHEQSHLDNRIGPVLLGVSVLA